MKPPYYCKIRETPIKVVEENGKRKHYVFDWKTGELNASSRFDIRPLGGIGGSETDLDELTKEEFEKQVLKAKHRIEINKSVPFFCISDKGAVYSCPTMLVTSKH